MRKNVVISINSSWNIQNFRRGLIKGLQDRGYEVIAVAPRDEYTPVLKELGVQHVAIEMDPKGASPHRDAKLLLDYVRILRRLRPVACLTYTPKPNVYGGLACRILGIPSIANITGLGSVFIEGGRLALLLRGLYRIAFARASTVFFQNPEDRQLLVEGGMVRPEQSADLPGSGVDLARFVPMTEKEGEVGPFTFLLIGRLLWDKGLGEFAEAARKIKGEVSNVRFQLVGFLDTANRTAVSQQDVDRWVEAGILEYLGSADDVRPYIRAADCVVLPSYREGLPRVLLEAAAMAKPVIATDVPGCRHVVDDGKTGLLCTVADAESLASRMMELMSMQPSERSDMGRAARRKVEIEFDERLTVERYLMALSKAVGDGL